MSAEKYSFQCSESELVEIITRKAQGGAINLREETIFLENEKKQLDDYWKNNYEDSQEDYAALCAVNDREYRQLKGD